MYRIVYTWDGETPLFRDFPTRREADLWRAFVEEMCRWTGHGVVLGPPRLLVVS